MKKTAISIGVLTVLSGVGAAAWAQAPATQPAQTQQTAPQTQQNAPRPNQSAQAQQTAPRSDQSAQTAPRSSQSAQPQQTAPRSSQSTQTSPGAASARGSSAGQAAALSDDAEKETARQQLELQAMDSNRNGLVTRQEYMSHYEDLYDDMKKDSAGMISLSEQAGSSSSTTGRPADSSSR